MTDDVVISLKMTGCHPFRSPPLRRGSADLQYLHRPLGLPQAVFAELSPLPPALAGGTGQCQHGQAVNWRKAGLQDRPVYSGGVSELHLLAYSTRRLTMSLDIAGKHVCSCSV